MKKKAARENRLKALEERQKRKYQAKVKKTIKDIGESDEGKFTFPIFQALTKVAASIRVMYLAAANYFKTRPVCEST